MIAHFHRVFGPEGEEIVTSQGAGQMSPRRSTSLGVVYRVGLPITFWIVFVNVAAHYHPKGMATDAVLYDVVQAELASRRCPGLRLDPVGFRELAQGRGFNHADIYQKRSPRLQRAATQLERKLRDDPESECQRMLDLYGMTGSTLHLLTRI
jgi:hypothetical protein